MLDFSWKENFEFFWGVTPTLAPQKIVPPKMGTWALPMTPRWFLFYSKNEDACKKLELNSLTLLLPGFLTNDYSPKLFSALGTFSWTCGSIINCFIVKGVHQWSYRKKLEGTQKIARVIAIFLSEKNFSKFEEKKSNFFPKLRLAIAKSIFKILGSNFLQTSPFL